MNFWTEKTLKEALGNAKFYNFPQDWNANGMIIWQENYEEGNMIMVRTIGQTKGVLPEKLGKIADSSSALLAHNPQVCFKYNKPVVELVNDNSDAIIKMARYIRKNFTGTVVGITGSSGKSTTTQMLVDIFSSKYKVNSNIESKANTTWGISWNMTRFNTDDDYWIIETSLGGGMSKNASITKPDYGIVMNVAPVHLTGGLTLQGVAEEKAKIFNFMDEGKTAIIYENTQFFDIIKNAAEFKNLNILTFGESKNADIRVLKDGGDNKFVIDGKTYLLNSEMIGKHILLDMAAALAVIKCEGFNIEEALEVLRNFKTLEGRGEVFDVLLDNKTITLVDEAYNANPLSMNAAITAFGEKYSNNNKILILGDMAECGEDTVKYHKELINPIDKINPQKLFLCGTDIKHLYDEIKDKYDTTYFDSYKTLMEILPEKLQDGDKVLLKASHSSGIHRIVSKLKKYKN